ncbi:MAG: small ribosomal subunit Rsm22 family protein [Christensenellaceae bacterium]|nr:small ribosomal subunit Rsm22 family protein [Christensenellaceae bacterium]
MRLPEAVERRLAHLAAEADAQTLLGGAKALSARYRASEKRGDGQSLLGGQEEVLSYALSRLPACYAAVCRALTIAGEGMELRQIGSVLDLGAGPGTASLAALSLCGPKEVTLIERDAKMASLAVSLLHEAAPALQPNLLLGEMGELPLPESDLILAAYCLLELDGQKADEMVEKMARSAKKLLLIVEPGTPEGHARLMRWKKIALRCGGSLLAPCPRGAEPCPLENDWCAFAARVERSALHRRLKGGSLPYEDEKFGFIAIAKGAFERPVARIRRHPLKQKGFVELALCRAGLTESLRVPKSAGEAYRAARKAEQGDAWE